MTERMTVTEYARHRVCSRQAVYQSLAAGRITRAGDGKIDPQVADRMWRERTDPLRGGPPAVPADTHGPVAVLGDQPARLAQAAAVVPALDCWTDFVDRSASRAARINPDPDPDSDPSDAIRSDPLALHALLYDLIANYLIETGQVDAERIDEADLIMFPIHPPKE